MKGKKLVMLVVVAVVTVIIYTQIALFVIPPIGALPEGKTVVILRLTNMQFIDSPDAMCERIQGGVNLLCRMAALAAVAENSKILLRLPYSEFLYGISTGGVTYSR